jgi:hypothetical protein
MAVQLEFIPILGALNPLPFKFKRAASSSFLKGREGG